MRMTTANVTLVAGVGFFFLAVFTQGLLPWLEPQSTTAKVTKVVRTDLGELKWMEDDATDYTEIEAHGRKVYIREGCWFCHSQYVRPVTGETRRWGPVTQSGEYAFDQPHLFSTRRIGPDLSRVGLKYSDEWHIAHFWDPRMLYPDSIMPRFAGLFEGPYKVAITDDAEGNRTVEENENSKKLFDFSSSERLLMTPNADGLVYVKERGKYPVIFTPNDEFSGDSVQVIALTDELRALVAYLQKLGTNRGKWRDRFEPQTMEAMSGSFPRSQEWVDYGKNVYQRRCVGCHGKSGDGNGPAATFMTEFRPRDFTLGVYKFRLTPSGSMPTDSDLLRTLTVGVRGSAMPSWHNLQEKDRLAVIQYIKYELSVDDSDPDNPYNYFVEEPPEPPLYIAEVPEPSEQIVANGKKAWQDAKCWECHGDTGIGDGEKSHELDDDFGYPIRPANLTTGQFKSGASVKDIYRTMTTGLSGTPMPSYADTLSEEDRWALAYYVVSLSAFKDPLTGKPLEISAHDRAALNNPTLKATESEYAYRPSSNNQESTDDYFAGEAWASKHGIEVLPKEQDIN